ncbi:hypothetical protein GCM10010249_60110 [Streptomyces roseolilacinus]|uniref:Uncharacterized protein n=1 Tax=Streptomyces roseolilacinus TaxID=66904 RepID=A0A918EPJ3_9ACTN|nr:hypothetical protein GCM10010249_60110 [Streptomyces roseolilacinus]
MSLKTAQAGGRHTQTVTPGFSHAELTGPSPVDRSEAGPKMHVMSDANDLPLLVGLSLPAARPLANRWISLPDLTTLKAFDETTGPCHCAAPMATDRDFFPPVMPPVTEAKVAWRLHRASAHPHLGPV